jgi:hypothetical protein
MELAVSGFVLDASSKRRALWSLLHPGAARRGRGGRSLARSRQAAQPRSHYQSPTWLAGGSDLQILREARKKKIAFSHRGRLLLDVWHAVLTFNST